MKLMEEDESGVGREINLLSLPPFSLRNHLNHDMLIIQNPPNAGRWFQERKIVSHNN